MGDPGRLPQNVIRERAAVWTIFYREGAMQKIVEKVTR